jgi:hypothetical protein
MLVDLRGIANPLKKDLFVEIDYMTEEVNDALGAKHSHLPKLEALQMVGEAFAKAPVSNPMALLASTYSSTSETTTKVALISCAAER